MRPRISSLTIRSFARMRSRRLFRLTWNLPARVLPQMKVKPRKLNRFAEPLRVEDFDLSFSLRLLPHGRLHRELNQRPQSKEPVSRVPRRLSSMQTNQPRKRVGQRGPRINNTMFEPLSERQHQRLENQLANDCVA